MLAYRKLVKLLVTPSYASNNQILSKYIFYFMEYFSLVIKDQSALLQITI